MNDSNTHIYLKNGFIGLANIEGNDIIKPNKYVCPDTGNRLMPSVKAEFQEGVLPVSLPGGKTGFIDETGNIQISFFWENAFPFFGGLSVVQSEGKWGMIDRQGQIVAPCCYEGIINQLQEDNVQKVFCAVYNGKFGYITSEGKTAIPFVLDNHIGKCSGEFREGVAPVVFNGKKLFIDYCGEVVIEPQDEFDFIGSYYKNFAMAIRYTSPHKIMHGFLNKQGELSVPVKYEQFGGSYSEGVMPVLFDKKLVYIDMCGRIILETDYDYVTDFGDGIAWGRRNGQWESFNQKGDIVGLRGQWDRVFHYKKDKWIVENGNTYGCVGVDGSQIYAPQNIPKNPFLDVDNAQWVFYCLQAKGEKTASMDPDFAD